MGIQRETLGGGERKTEKNGMKEGGKEQGEYRKVNWHHKRDKSSVTHIRRTTRSGRISSS